MTAELITTNELIEARMDETGLTKEQLLLVVAKSALVRHLASGPTAKQFVLKGGTLLAHCYNSPRESVVDADYSYVDPTLPTVPQLVKILTVDGKEGFHLDADAAKWTTDTDIFKATGMPFSIDQVTFGTGRRRALAVSMTVRSGECLDGPRTLTYTDTMLAGSSRFQALGLSLEELAAEKVLGWASKDLPKHYIDLAYIARNHASTMSLDRSGELIVKKFERERQQRRYRGVNSIRQLAEAFNARDRIDAIRRGWDEALGNNILFLPSEVERENGSLAIFENVERHIDEVWVPLLERLSSPHP